MSKRPKFKAGDIIAIADPVEYASTCKQRLRHLNHTAQIIEVKKDLLVIDRPFFGEAGTADTYGATIAFKEEVMLVSQGFEHPQSVRDDLAKARISWSLHDWNRHLNNPAISDWPDKTTSQNAA